MSKDTSTSGAWQDTSLGTAKGAWHVNVDGEQAAQLEPAIAHQIRDGVANTPEHKDDAERVIRILVRLLKDEEIIPAGFALRPATVGSRRVLRFKASGSFKPLETEITIRLGYQDLYRVATPGHDAPLGSTPARVADLSEHEADSAEGRRARTAFSKEQQDAQDGQDAQHLGAPGARPAVVPAETTKRAEVARKAEPPNVDGDDDARAAKAKAKKDAKEAQDAADEEERAETKATRRR